MSYYTIVGYDKETDAETKLDADTKRQVESLARQFARDGLIDIQVFYQNDNNEETATYDWIGSRLVAG